MAGVEAHNGSYGGGAKTGKASEAKQKLHGGQAEQPEGRGTYHPQSPPVGGLRMTKLRGNTVLGPTEPARLSW